jgi:hypothetical protein
VDKGRRDTAVEISPSKWEFNSSYAIHVPGTIDCINKVKGKEDAD